MDPGDVLNRGIPDALSTDALPPVLAAELDHLAGRTEPWQVERTDVHRGVHARALAAAGDVDAARAALAACSDGSWTPQGVVAAAWAMSRVGSMGLADDLHRALGACESTDGFLADGDVPLGPPELVSGWLAVTEGDLGTASVELQLASSVGDARAPIWGALCRLERHRVVVTAACGAGRPVDQAARSAFVSARTFFAAGGYRHQLAVAERMDAPPGPADVVHPTLGHLIEDGEWSVGFGVQPPVLVAPSRGLVAIRHLIRNRHRLVPAVELDHVVDGRPYAPLDPASVRRVIDGGGADRVRELLTDERARSRVSKLVRRTIDRLGSRHRVLVEHLSRSVRTGFVCGYEAPDVVVWRTTG